LLQAHGAATAEQRRAMTCHAALPCRPSWACPSGVAAAPSAAQQMAAPAAGGRPSGRG
jgi:hypothetical protein